MEPLRQARSVVRSVGWREFASRAYRFAGSRLAGSRFYHAPAVRLASRAAATHRTFVDVGAHVGDVFAPVAARYERAVALEPLPANAAALRARVAAAGLAQARVLEAAAGAAAGRAVLSVSATNTGDNSLAPRDDLAGAVEVEVVQLDDVLRDLPPPFFVKIDVQGAEEAVLAGAAGTLAGPCTLLMEYWPYGLRRAGTDGPALLRRLRGLGYAACDAEGRPVPEARLDRWWALGASDRYVVSDLLLRREAPRAP